MDKSTVYFSVEISGILGKIIPEIKVKIPQRVLFCIVWGAAKKAVRQELKRHDAQAALTAPVEDKEYPADGETTDYCTYPQ